MPEQLNSFLADITDRYASVRSSKNFKLIMTLVLVLAVPLTVVLAMQINDIRQRASGPATPTTPPTPTGQKVAYFLGSRATPGYISSTTPSVPLISPLTVEAWINPEYHSETNGYVVVATGKGAIGDPDVGLTLWINTSSTTYSLKATVSDGKYLTPINQTDTPPLVYGVWTHVAVTYDVNKTFRLFVNGHAIASRTMSYGGPVDLNKGWSVGAQVYDGKVDEATQFKGAIDNVRISNAVRYVGEFIPSKDNFVVDGNTLLLQDYTDGNVQNGQVNGPVYFIDGTVNSDVLPPVTPTVIPSVYPTYPISPTPTNSPSLTPTPTSFPTATPTKVPTPTRTPTPTPYADLVVRDFVLTDAFGRVKSTFKRNEPIFVKVTIGNQGNKPGDSVTNYTYSQIFSNKPTTVQAGLTSDVSMSMRNGEYSAGYYKTYYSTLTQLTTYFFPQRKSWTKSTAGTYTARIHVNYDRGVKESDYTNNQRTVTYTVR